MRILLAHNSTYYPAHGGGDKSNRLLVEALAARGHRVRVVARTAAYGPAEHAAHLGALSLRGVEAATLEPGVAGMTLNGVDVHTITGSANIRAYFERQIETFQPEVILTSTDDSAQLLLDAALRAGTARVVYLVRATLALPFGPDCAVHSPALTANLARVDAIVGVSEYVAGYIRRHSGFQATHVPISLMDPGPWPELGRHDNEFAVLVNPCAVKGIDIFTALAARLPQVRFAAVPTWGTNAENRAVLAAHANITVLDPFDNIDDLFARTRVLLVPSLWAEARSRIVVEAMLRGIPVIASDIGGIPEAKLGVPYLLPVNPIARYKPALDEQMVPVAEVPPQDIEPWAAALTRLWDDPAHYAGVSRASRAAATSYAASIRIEPFERRLLDLPPHRAKAPLSPEKRRLLALRLKKAAPAWFQPDPAARCRLFCFPHAGGGAAAFRNWAAALPGVDVVPARLPGREARAAEEPCRTMDELVSALAAAIEPHLGAPFAFFGHSMGAIVAFELARRFAPQVLIASGARAPLFRLKHVPPPDPSDKQFFAELRRLEGLPQAVLDAPDLLALLARPLKADAALYRRYVYTEQPPLACPIVVYGGLSDPNIGPEHRSAWAGHTAASFVERTFPGGHFYWQQDEPAFLRQLAADLSAHRIPVTMEE